jgi:gluconate 2-dehydrogenase gamma chain
MKPESVGLPASADRRALLQQLGLLLGAAALPASAVFGAAARSAPRYLDTATFRLVTAVSDTLVPRTDTAGAVQAGIPQVFDALLRDWAAAATRTQLIDALKRIDAAALAQSGRPFAQLRAPARHALLQAHDAAALKPAPVTQPLSVDAMLAGGPPVADAGYRHLKDLVVTLYYSSKAGLTQELTYVHAPGKWQPSVPVSKGTRPAGGGGLF